MVPDQKTAVIALFNHPAGYGVRADPILDEVIGPRKMPKAMESALARSDASLHGLQGPQAGIYRTVSG